MIKKLDFTKPILIGFSGKKQSGKNISADYVYNKLSIYYKSVYYYAFADRLKQDICINILGLMHNQCYGEDIDKDTLTTLNLNGIQLTAREVMQYIGTDIFRNLNSNIWIDATLNKIKKDTPNIALITDVRFPNEVESIQNNNGIVIRLTRSPILLNHLSEIALDNYSNFDCILDNKDMTKAEQFVYLDGILTHFKLSPQ